MWAGTVRADGAFRARHYFHDKILIHHVTFFKHEKRPGGFTIETKEEISPLREIFLTNLFMTTHVGSLTFLQRTVKGIFGIEINT